VNGPEPIAPGAAGYSTLRVERLEDGAVLRILLDRPKGNVLTRAMMNELADALDRHASDPGLRLVVLRGAGGHFSFGASVEEHRRDQVAGMLATFHALARRVARHPIPVAALVEGRCLGGAFELVLCCHFVFATPGAVFGCPEIKLGVFPPVLAAAGAARLGGPRAEHLLLTGEEMDAETAAGAGLVVSVLAGYADPEQGLMSWYRRCLAPLSAYALRQAVRASRAGSALEAALGAPLDQAERLYLDRVMGSHDGNEGIEAFLARRAPEWRHA
jgi:cyclohexa-1,5-dienecarbonyl-CoA hydratase